MGALRRKPWDHPLLAGSRRKILLTNLEESLASEIEFFAEREGFRPLYCCTTDALSLLSQDQIAAVVVGLRANKTGGGIELLRSIRRVHPSLCILAIANASSEELALAAFRAGATDYLPHPASIEELAELLDRHTPRVSLQDSTNVLVGDSDDLRAVRIYIHKVAATDSNVLVTGETGTGKELVAGLIHQNSGRREQPFVCVNCAGIPDTLLESELFGYERGAFTGAHLSTPGKIEAGNGGTVFFDEIGELSPYGQVRLLRVIEEKKLHRLGGRKPISLNIRIVAATNRDLDTLAGDQTFRRDLYFRLNIARIHLTPLRERKLDIPQLIDHYIAEFNRQFHAQVQGMDNDVVEHLLAYQWPGNVRELRNLLEGVFVTQPSEIITFSDLPDWFRNQHPRASPDLSESDRLLSALHASNWNKSEAAERLNCSRMTIYRKIAKYRLGTAIG
ncbi:MAG TPA: sigma-54 dependent transcriptional regulator [Bryobacteraceae bacterium]|nr:sigma-54 dependent transcriptional regulator [Bryobacteraceae bacterium]